MRCEELKVGPIERRQQAIPVLLNIFHNQPRNRALVELLMEDLHRLYGIRRKVRRGVRRRAADGMTKRDFLGALLITSDPREARLNEPHVRPLMDVVRALRAGLSQMLIPTTVA